MLAYSSIAHSGYMLMAIVAGPEIGLPALLFYLLAYGVTNNAIFGALSGIERNGQEVEKVEDLAGLVRRRADVLDLGAHARTLVGLRTEGHQRRPFFS